MISLYAQDMQLLWKINLSPSLLGNTALSLQREVL